MKSLNLLKLSFAAAAVFFGTETRTLATVPVFTPVPTAFTITDGTYSFTSSTTDHSVDGSTVTVAGSSAAGYTLSSWDILDTNNATSFPDTTGNLNSTTGFQSLGNNDWSFAFTFSGFNVSGSDNAGTGSLFVAADPPGIWTLESSITVPDATSTLGLVAAAFALLGICGRRTRQRSVFQA